jgi:hypothetical protein
MTFHVYELLHAGEGPRGRMIEILNCRSEAEAACLASEDFDQDDDRQQRIYDGHDHHDGCSRVVEVVAEGTDGKSPARFRVRCRVVRRYEAEPED